MAKSIILSANLGIQHHNIIRIPRTRLENMIERFAIRVNWCNESVEVHASTIMSYSSSNLVHIFLLQIDCSPEFDLISSGKDSCISDVIQCPLDIIRSLTIFSNAQVEM
jgi:hypothetical protein